MSTSFPSLWEKQTVERRLDVCTAGFRLKYRFVVSVHNMLWFILEHIDAAKIIQFTRVHIQGANMFDICEMLLAFLMFLHFHKSPSIV